MAVRRRFRDVIALWRSFSQALEEGEDAIGVQRGDRQRGRLDARLPMDELQQQTERIAIARDRLHAQTFLCHQILCEEDLEQRPDEDRRRHEAPPSWPGASTRLAAVCRSAGVPVTYQ